MTVSITIPDVPDHVHDELAGRAARKGQSLQEYLRTLLLRAAEHPTADVVDRARARVAATGSTVVAADILSARDADRR